MNATPPQPWPPTPEEAPSLDDLWSDIEVLRTQGTDTYRQEERAYREANPEEWAALDRLQQHLEDDEVALELLSTFEEHNNYLGGLWGEDRFRIGFSLGAHAWRLFT